MKKNLLILGMMALVMAFTIPAKAQARTTMQSQITQGQYIDIGGANFVPFDSLQVSDTISYVIPINHVNMIWPYITWIWTKSGAGTASVTVLFTQGNDPTFATNYFPVKAGIAKSTYTKTFSLSAAGNTVNEISFARDTAYFEGRYLRISFRTDATASVKGFLAARVKAIVQ